MKIPPEPSRQHLFRLKLALTAALSLLILGWLSWEAYSDFRYADAQLPAIGRMEIVRAEIVQLDEILTMSARMAATTGNLEWETRYLQFEPQLDKSIKEAIRLHPNTSLGAAAAKTDAANIRLVAMEHRAFELVRQEKHAEAQRLLSSEEYQAHKRIYAAGMTEFNLHLLQANDSARARLQANMRRSAITTIGAAVLLVLSSLFVFRTTRRWQAVIVESNWQLDQKTTELGESNSQLDRKVTEHSKEISSLYAVLAPLRPSDSLNQMLERVIERLMEATKADGALIRLRDPITGIFLCAAARGFGGAYLESAERVTTGSAVEQVFTTGQPIVSPEIISDPRVKGKLQLQVGLRSCAFLPLTESGKTRGIIHLASRTPGFFSQEKEENLMAIARQMSIAIENQELYAETHRNLERIRALHNIDTAITSTLDLRTVLKVLLKEIDLFLPFAAATSITLVDRSSGELEPVLSWGLDEQEWKQAAQKARNSLAELVHKSQSAIIIENTQTDVRTHNPEFFIKYGLGSYLGVPLKAKDGFLGVLGLYTKGRHAFNDREIEFLSTLGGQAAIAIHNSQLYEDTRLRESQVQEANLFLSALHTVSAAASQSLDLDQVLTAAIEKITSIFHFDATRVRIYDANAETLFLKSCFERNPAYRTDATVFRKGEGIVGRVVESGHPLIFEDIEVDPLYRQLSQTKTSKQFNNRFVAVFPIKGKHGSVGTLGCAGKDPRKLTPAEIQLLESMADRIAVAIENSELYEQVKKKVQELEQQTVELRQANKVKNEFLSIMSHELRTPLIVIRGYAELIKDEAFGKNTPEQAKGIRVIKDRTEELLAMIVTIFDVTRLEGGTMPVQREGVDLLSLLDTLKESYANSNQPNVKIEWDFATELPMVVTDGPKIKYILNNLINNAVKFTPKGFITVSARYLAGEQCLAFQVRDTGVGIPNDMLPFIFEKFHQIDSTDARNYEGVGLGLYVVKQYTLLLGGDIHVESEVGHGSTFNLRIPCGLPQGNSVSEIGCQPLRGGNSLPPENVDVERS